MAKLTLAELVNAIRKSAGDSDVADLDGDILDITFEELGYDSVALLELSVTLRSEHGITLSDDEILNIETPRGALELINGQKDEVI